MTGTPASPLSVIADGFTGTPADRDRQAREMLAALEEHGWQIVSVFDIAEWTVGADGHTNTSPAFLGLVTAVEEMIRISAHSLVNGQADRVALFIVAQLAHRHGLAPTQVPA